MNYLGVSRNKHRWGPSQLSTYLNSQHTLRIYAATKGLDGDAKTDCLRTRERYTALHLTCTLFHEQLRQLC